MDDLFDPVRKEWVAATPEERVRQHILSWMIGELGYPASLMVIEKELRLLVPSDRVLSSKIPDRRIDILAFGKKADGHLFPLLLIECKAIALGPRVMRQVAGYNEYIGAPFIAIANAREVLTGHYEATVGDYQLTSGLPAYSILLAGIR